MKEIVAKTLKFYFEKMRAPEVSELQLSDTSLMDERACFFVTLFLNGEVHGSAGNVKEIEENAIKEIIQNTISAVSKDKRFAPLTLEQSEKLWFRVDKIISRNIIHSADIKKLDPVKNGIICIKRDYEKLAVLLPNITPSLLTWEDMIPVIQNKLSEKSIDDKNFIVYQIETLSETSF